MLRLLEERLDNRHRIRDMGVTILPVAEIPQIARSRYAPLTPHPQTAIGNAKGHRPSSIVLAGLPLRRRLDRQYHHIIRTAAYERPAYLPRGREATRKVPLIIL